MLQGRPMPGKKRVKAENQMSLGSFLAPTHQPPTPLAVWFGACHFTTDEKDFVILTWRIVAKIGGWVKNSQHVKNQSQNVTYFMIPLIEQT